MLNDIKKSIFDENFDKMLRDLLIRTEKFILAEFYCFIKASKKKKKFNDFFTDLLLAFLEEKYGGD